MPDFIVKAVRILVNNVYKVDYKFVEIDATSVERGATMLECMK